MNATDTPATVRAHAIAATHAALKFIADEELDAPATITLNHHVSDGQVSDRIRYVEAFAERYALQVETGGVSMWATLHIATGELNGVDITYNVLTTVTEPRESWDPAR